MPAESATRAVSLGNPASAVRSAVATENRNANVSASAARLQALQTRLEQTRAANVQNIRPEPVASSVQGISADETSAAETALLPSANEQGVGAAIDALPEPATDAAGAGQVDGAVPDGAAETPDAILVEGAAEEAAAAALVADATNEASVRTPAPRPIRPIEG